jgi:tRNA nucleotidyltransferase (CCA-adding enzyme)
VKKNLDQKILTICKDIVAAGGHPFVVGGWVRDQILGLSSKDIDIEVCHMSLDVLQRVLSHFGAVDVVGRAFGVLKIHGLDVDFSLPRKDSKVAEGHRGFEIALDPDMSSEEAARRRDLTINSISYDVSRGIVVDPFNGQQDLRDGVLRATDPETFIEDPLRALRVCQFAARFGFTVSDQLVDLCRTLDLSELPGERIMGEFEKLFLKGKQVGYGLQQLQAMDLLRFFPELAAMADTPQDPIWHPEGDVWTHTLMVVDEAAKLRTDDREHNLVLMFAALCHDMGKPLTITFEVDGEEVERETYEKASPMLYFPETTWEETGHSKLRPRIRSCGHEAAGEQPTREFMRRLMAPHDLVEAVCALVAEHLAPHMFMKNKAKAGAFRRLARKLAGAGTSLEMLHKVGIADHFGRTTPDALAREYPAGDWFVEQASDLEIKEEGPADVVMGRHLIKKGWKPGPHFGVFLDKCREVQYDTGWTDPDMIIECVENEH